MHHLFQKNVKSGPPAETWENPTVFLPGWGFCGDIISLAQPALPCYYPTTPLDPETLAEDLLALMDKEKLARIELIGWSMGALLALDFAGRYPDRLAGLVLIALRRHWPAVEIGRIRAELAENPTAFMTGFYRKCFVGHKAAYEKFKAGLEPYYLDTMCQAMPGLLAKGLAYLGTRRGRAVAGVKAHLIHGRKDLIAPLAQMASLPGATLEIIEHAGHLPFLAGGCSLGQRQKKRTIRQKFSRAAATYDQYALVQKQVADRLVQSARQDLPAGAVADILEIGCGTGNYTALLAGAYPGAAITALDFSREMIAAARSKLAAFPGLKLVGADGEVFLAEAASGTFGLITSNGVLQWFTDPDRAFANISRLLRTGGLFLCSIFGPRSLEELGRALSQVCGAKIVLASAAFLEQKELGRRLAKYFAKVEVEELLIPHRYSSLHDLLVHLKKTGTAGWQETEPPFLGKTRLAGLDRWFTENHGGCLVTYQVFIIRCT